MKTVLSIKTDKKLKEKVQKLSKEMGVPISMLVNNYFRYFVEERGVYFAESYKKEVLKPHVAKRLAKIHEDIKNSRNMVGPFKTSEEMDEYLDSL